MKKSLLFLLPCAALILAGCGNDSKKKSEDEGSSKAPTSTSVIIPYVPTHAGTEADPLDAKDAYNLSAELKSSGSEAKYPSQNKYYIRDEVTTVTECSASFGNATFILGPEETPFTGYRLKLGSTKTNIPSDDYIQVGDVVTIYSDLLNFHGTMETNDGYIVDVLMPPATGVAVTSEADEENVAVGGTLQMGYTLSPAHSSGTVTWSVECDPANCASIDANGLLTGAAVGTATVKAHVSQGVEATKVINVITPTNKLIKTIAFEHDEYSVDLNSGVTVATGVDVTWNSFELPEEAIDYSSSDENVATVSDAGVVTIVTSNTAKTATITAEGHVSHKKATTTVKVTDSVAPVALTEFAAETNYKIGMFNTQNGIFYFGLGGKTGNYGSTEEAIMKAADVQLEISGTGENAIYKIKFISGAAASKYLTMVKSGTYYNYAESDSDSIGWKYNATYNTFTIASGECEGYALGTYGANKTFGGTAPKNFASNYLMHIYTTDGYTDPAVRSMKITTPDINDAIPGQSIQLSYIYTPSYTRPLSLTGVSSDPNVVQVNTPAWQLGVKEDAGGQSCDVTLTIDGHSDTIHIAVLNAKKGTFNLRSTVCHETATNDLVTWKLKESEADRVTFTLGKGTSTHNADESLYQGSYSTFYRDHALSFSPASGYKIYSIKIGASNKANGDGLALAANCVWTNASVTRQSDTVVAITPTVATNDVTATLPLANVSYGNIRVTFVEIIYMAVQS